MAFEDKPSFPYWEFSDAHPIRFFASKGREITSVGVDDQGSACVLYEVRLDDGTRLFCEVGRKVNDLDLHQRAGT